MKDFDANVKVMAQALLEGLHDKEDIVNDSVHKSLCKIASGSQCNLVLSTFCEYRALKKKIDTSHMVCMLKAVEQICMQQGEYLESDIIHMVTDIVIKEMVSNMDYVPEIQMPASGILVAIGNHHCDQVVKPLLDILKPGIIPHYTIVHTLGTLSATNINGTVHFLKVILSKILPTLGMIKIDPLKQAFSYALGNFCTALNDYFGNNHHANSDLKKTDFVTEISIAFDVLQIHWLHSSEPKVVENVLEAIGPMFSLLPVEKIKELVPKLIPLICNLYKKTNVDAFFVTQALTLILVECVRQEVFLPSTLIDMINLAMFHSVLTFPDYDHPQKIKNHFELLRCFDILATNFSDQVVEHLFVQTKNNNEEEKMRSLIILTHLITSSEMSVKVIVGRFNAILKTMIITEHSCKMKRIILKAIVALAYRQYLDNTEDRVLIEFIINQCSSENSQSNKTELTFLIDDCENSLYLLSSTVPNMKKILWPILMESLLNYNDNETLSVVAKCLSHFVKSESKDESEFVSKQESLPSNEAVYVRCMSLLIETSDGKLINNVVQFLVNYCSSINKDLKVSWEMDLQKLITFLESNNFDDEIWESMIIDLFRSAMFLVNDNNWVETVSQKILEQIPKNEKFTKRKGLLFKFLSILLCHVVDPQNINHGFDTLFNALHNSSPEEGKQIARALGIASIKHGSIVVEKLNIFAHDLENRKSTRFLNFNFMKNSKQDSDLINLKQSVTLCYGEIAKEVIDEDVLSQLKGSDSDGGGALLWSINQLKNYRQHHLKLSALNTIQLLAKAVKSVANPNITISDRWNLVNLALDQMFENSSKSSSYELFPPVVQVITALIKLSPNLAPEERNLVLRTVCVKVFNSMNILKTKFNSVEEEAANDALAKYLNDSLIALNILIKEFMLQSVCPSTLDDFLSILEEWVDNPNDDIRTSVMRSIQVALVCFIQNVKLTYENPSKFGQAGLIIGKMVPRCADKNSTVRYVAIDCIKILIQIIDLYEGRSAEINSETFQSLASIQMQIGTNEVEKLSTISSDLADVISNKIPHQQTLQLIESLLSGVYGEELPGLVCNIVLKGIIKKKGQDLYQNVEDVMDFILPPLGETQGKVRQELLNVMLTLANHHTKSVVTYLLLKPLPFEGSVSSCWQTLASDENTAKLSVEILYHTLETEALFEESVKYDKGKVVSVHSLSAMSALYIIFKQPEVSRICVEKLHKTFSMIYTIFVCFIGADPPAHTAPTGTKSEKYGFVPNHQASKLLPQKIALDTLEQFLNNANCKKAGEACLQYFQTDESDNLESFFNVNTYIVEAFCKHYPQHLPQIVSSLNNYSRSSLTPQRIAVMAFLSLLIKHRCMDNLVLLETAVATLNSGWKDATLEVRATSLAGLSNIKHLKPEQYEHYLLPIIGTLYGALDDYQGSSSRNNIPLVAMKGLHGLFILKGVKEKPLNEMPPLLQRIKTFFNTDNPDLRKTSILLFGEIIHSNTSEECVTQVLSVFPCFVYHLADEDHHVVKACKQTLKKITPMMAAEKTNNMIQTHLIDSAKLHLGDFTMDLMKRCAVELPDHVAQFIEDTFSYLNSPWDCIRTNATLSVGILFSYYKPSEEQYEENKKHLMTRLFQLLKDSNSRVRSAAAMSLSSLSVSTALNNEK